jgi:hypothetical protein
VTYWLHKKADKYALGFTRFAGRFVMMPVLLAERIHQFVADRPAELVVQLAAALQEAENGRWSQIDTKVRWVVNQPDNRQKVTDANLTDYAVTLNMEMGILVQGGEAP